MQAGTVGQAKRVDRIQITVHNHKNIRNNIDKTEELTKEKMN